MNDLAHAQPTLPDQPFLLAADLDGTLLGDESGEAWLKAFVEKHAGSLHLAYVTGRYRSSVLQLIAAQRLPRPNYICSDVGTELFDCDDPQNRLGEKYAAQVAPGWDLDEIYARGMGQGIWLQDFPDGQPRFQAGFFWDGQPENFQAFLERFAMADARADYAIYPSYAEYIDVLPGALGKGQAVRFLQRELSLPVERVVVAGDSGNDRQMFEGEFKGILPVNALDELKQVACRPWHYHSPFPAARGVLDGLRHFQFIEPGRE